MKRCMWGGQLAFALLALSLAAFAQSIISGEVAGTVTDPTGAVVRNATITLSNTETGAKRTVVTNDSGAFRFPLLHPGAYQISAEAQGFQSMSQRVTVGVGQVTNASLQMSPGSVSQTIEVSGAAPILQTENANLATTYNPTQIQNLPNPGGDLTNYALSAPGVVLSTGAGYGNFTAYGMPGTSNLFTINGGDMNDPYNNLNNSGSSNNMLGQNEIQEVAIVHNGYTGQYGRGASVNMNFTTKSGTNSFHGNAKWQWNGRYLNANDWFNNNSATPRPFANSNQWGGSFGGPIIKNKLFFFYDNEGLRYVLPGGSSPVYVPTTTWANSIMANIAATQPAELPFYQQMFSLYAAAPGASRATPVDPAGSKSGGCGDFAGSSLGGTLFGAPGGQACTKTFRTLVNNLNKERLQAIRVDWNATSRDTMSFRYFQDRGTQPTYTDPINSAFNALSNQPQDNGQFILNHQFTPNVVNQLILGGLYYSAIFGPASIAKATSVFPTSIGVAAGPNNCTLLDGNLSCMGGEVYRYPQGRNVTQYQLVDDLSWTRGNHALKFGANFRRVDFSDYAPAANHTGNLRMSSITDFVDGVLSSNGSQLRQQFAQANNYQINNYSLGFYGQDEWRVSRNLKLTLALRLDRNSNETCVKNCFSRFAGDFSTLNHSLSTPYNQSVLAGQGTLFNSLQPIVWQPRAGFAWSPRGSSTVVRGGGGLFSDLYPAQLSSSLISNPPNLALWTISASGSQIIPIAPGVPGSAFTRAANNNAAFVNGFFNGGTLASIKAQVPSFTGPNFYTTSHHMLNPKYAEWNLEIQQGFGTKTVASVNYVGNHGMDLLILKNGVNAFAKSGHFGALPTAAPDPRFGVVTQLTNGAISNYNGVTGSLTRRMTEGFTGTLSYTFSHSADTISNAGIQPYSTNQAGDSLRFQVDPSNSRLNYGPSDYDFRHVLSFNYVWQLPLAQSNRFLGGWTISGVLYKRSGQPYSVVNPALPGRLGNYNTANAAVIANFLGGPTPSCTVNGATSLTDNQQTNPFACLTTAQFATTSAQTGFGNIGRNFFRGPGYFNTDFSIKKNFRVTEQLALELGANAYNVLNHPNFGNPDSSLTSGTFGTIQNTVTPASSPYGNFQGSAVSGRVLQLELGVSF